MIKYFVDDLMWRIANPHLKDLVERVGRDPKRKLGVEDRMINTMRQCYEYNIEPKLYALGVAAALMLLKEGIKRDGIKKQLNKIWGNKDFQYRDDIIGLVEKAFGHLKLWYGPDFSVTPLSTHLKDNNYIGN